MIARAALTGVASVVLALAPVASGPAHAAGGECIDNVGVTIVVDFQELGDGVSLACAVSGASSGLDALNKAGVSWEGTKRFPGLVCRIAGRPGADAEPCMNAPPASAYWSYWMAPRGGQWCYASVGPGNRTPPPGSVEGWSFSLHHQADAAPAPRYAPPAPIPGTTPRPIAGGECTTPAASPGTTSPPASSGLGTTPPGDVTAPTAYYGATTTARAPTAAATVAAAAPTSTSTGATTEVPTSTSRESSATTGASQNVAINAVDLHDDGRGGPGSPAGLVAGVAVVGVLGAGALLTARRRRRT